MTNYQLLDVQPRPRGLFQDLSDELVGEIASLFPYYKRVTANETVHDDEFDVLIIASQPWGRSNHLNTVAFGLVPQRVPSGEANFIKDVTLNKRTLATELSIPITLPSDLKELIQLDLYPIFRVQAEKYAVQLEFLGVFGNERSGTLPEPNTVTPFIIAGGDSILSGAFTQLMKDYKSKGGRVWFLPDGVAHPATWIRLALREFSVHDPVRVPAPSDWWTTGDWNTPEQVEMRKKLHDLEKERERQEANFAEQSRMAREEISEADSRAHSGMLRLLTQDGDLLVDAVKNAFESFGFQVTNMDEIHAVGDRREDLRVRDPENPDWLSLVEIKGYVNGAKVTDLAKLERHASRFASENGGRLPDAKWHVVNAFRGMSPLERPVAIPNDDELVEFAKGGGMLLDTRELFRVLKLVNLGFIETHLVRTSLTTNQMRWVGPSPSSK